MAHPGDTDVLRALKAEPLSYESREDMRRRMAGGKASGESSPVPIASATRAGGLCPACGVHVVPTKRARGSRAVLLVLLLLPTLFILLIHLGRTPLSFNEAWAFAPALLYYLFHRGYAWSCPRCRAKMADVI